MQRENWEFETHRRAKPPYPQIFMQQRRSSTSRNESEYRRHQRTAHRISPGSVCRHLNIAGRIAFFMISSGY